METRGRNAPYRVQLTPISEPGWRLIARDHYRNLRFQRREVLTYESVDAATTRTVP